MFIIPVGNRVDWKRPPAITILLILVNCFVYFFLQSDSHHKDERATEYYLNSELPRMEWPQYSTYLIERSEFAEQSRFEELRRKGGDAPLVMMQDDSRFMRELRAGNIIMSAAPEFAIWKYRRDTYESMRSFTSRYIFHVDDPSVKTSTVSAFMHGSLDHLIGNMIVLFLVGFMVESVIGKSMYLLAYAVSIYAADLMFAVTAPGGAALGASGAIAGIMGLYTVVFGLRKIDFFYTLGFYFDYVRAPAIALLPLWLGNELYQFFAEKGAHIAYMAHFGGLIGGAVMGAVYRWKSPAMIESYHEVADRKEMDAHSFQRGMECLGRMEFKKALGIFKSLQEKHPEDINLTLMIFRAAKSEPDGEDFHQSALALLSVSDMDMATSNQVHALYKEYLSSAKPSATLGHDLIARLAKRFAEAGYCDDAEKLMSDLERSAPQHAELLGVWLSLARAYYRSQRKDKSEEILQALIRQFPDSIEAEVAAGMLRVG
jgi:membrane associated rhomboid family serine protease